MITGCRKFDNLFVSRGRGRRDGWVCASDIWSRAKIGRDLTHCCFQKLEHFLRVFIFASVFFLPCCVIRWFLRLSNVTFIIVTRNDTVSCYLFQGHRNQWAGAEREAKNIAGLIFVETKNTSSIASADFSYYHYFFLFFFLYTPSWKGRPSSNKQCHDKEKKFRSSGKHWWASRSHIGPFVAFYAFHSPFSYPFTSSSFHARSRPYFQSTDLL